MTEGTRKEVTTYYLEMTSPDALREKPIPAELTVTEARIKQYQLNRFMYRWVGGPWDWTEKRVWTESQWKSHAEEDRLRTWIAYCQGTPAGYYELQQQDDGNVEITNFGLATRFVGQGLGGPFLSHAIKSAWGWEGTQRVWVHTCTKDHPSALQNYKSRGMMVYRTETKYQDKTEMSS